MKGELRYSEGTLYNKPRKQLKHSATNDKTKSKHFSTTDSDCIILTPTLFQLRACTLSVDKFSQTGTVAHMLVIITSNNHLPIHSVTDPPHFILTNGAEICAADSLPVHPPTPPPPPLRV